MRSLDAGFVVLGATVVATVVAVTATTTIIHDGKIQFHERFPMLEISDDLD